MEETATKTKMAKGKKIRLIVIIAAAVLILLGGLLVYLHSLGYFLWPWENNTVMISGNISQGELDFTDSAKLAEQLQELADADHVTFQMNTKPVFDSNGQGDFMIQNPDFNKYDMTVEIYLGSDETGMLVYESDTIPPGHYIAYDYLKAPLNQGNHEAIAILSYWNGETLMTTASVDMTLVIQG